METIIGTILFLFILVWAFRVEINTAKTKEGIERIEELLKNQEKGKK